MKNKNLAEVFVWFSCLGFITSNLYPSVSSTSSAYMISLAEKSQLEYLQEELSNGGPDRKRIKDMLWNAARFNYQLVVDKLIDLPDGIGPNQEDINAALIWASRFDRRTMVGKLISLPKGQLRPDQESINMALSNSAGSGHEDLVDMLLDCSKEKINPDQLSVNGALELSVEVGHHAVMRLLMDRQEEQLHPDQSGIISAYRQAIIKGRDYAIDLLEDFAPEEERQNKRLVNATRLGNKVAVEGLLSISSNQLGPNQAGINMALINAAVNGNQAMVELFMNRHGNLRPDQSNIILAYREAFERRLTSIITVLEPFVPEAERQNQIHRGGQRKGLAFEIHNYAGTMVRPSVTSLHKSNTLVDAVFGNMQERTCFLLTYTESKKEVAQAIEKYIPKSKRMLAKHAAFYRLGSDYDYEQKLRVAVTFIQKFHADKMEQWIVGFVNESIDAYKNSSNPLSCSKGIRERVATGLRGIDTDLDKLFIQAEAPMLVKNWLKSWNLNEISESAKQELVKQLKPKGIGEHSNAADVANAFKEIAKEQLTAHGVNDDSDLLAEIEIYADSMIEPNYDEMLKPCVLKPK